MNDIQLNDIKTIYFVGIGGIGMSALARYFLLRGCAVHGYDKTATDLTRQLEAEGMVVHYVDDISYIPKAVDLVVFTPAIPKNHTELTFFQENNYPILKRSEVLGIISRGMKCVGVAGTHGKTTTSSIVTHILRTGGIDATAFLGGISLSLGSNFVAGNSEWVVVEADEFDRSFLRLSPDLAVVTAIDPDHLDIYGDAETFRQGFLDYLKKMKTGGTVFPHAHLALKPDEQDIAQNIDYQDYGIGEGVYRAENVRVENGYFVFDFDSPKGHIEAIKMTLPGRHNIENATAAIAVAQQLGVSGEKIKEALGNFKGIKRRFEFVVRPNTEGGESLGKTDSSIFIDDYAHHPTELESAIGAARELFPNKYLTGIFQPHLFTRTRDFLDGFVAALDKLDKIILLDIYPARELPIEGVTSALIFNQLQNPNKILTDKAHLMTVLEKENFEVLMTLGAGDIDTFVKPIKEMLSREN